MLPYSAQRKTFARHLRRAQTDAEGKLWLHLRNRRLYGVKFRRQHPIGKYIANFCSVESELIIELDGGQHMERTKEDGQRSRFFEHKGFRVLRFWNNEVLLNTEAVVEQIARFIGDRRTCSFPEERRGELGGCVNEKEHCGDHQSDFLRYLDVPWSYRCSNQTAARA